MIQIYINIGFQGLALIQGSNLQRWICDFVVGGLEKHLQSLGAERDFFLVVTSWITRASGRMTNDVILDCCCNKTFSSSDLWPWCKLLGIRGPLLLSRISSSQVETTTSQYIRAVRKTAYPNLWQAIRLGFGVPWDNPKNPSEWNPVQEVVEHENAEHKLHDPILSKKHC